MLLTKVCRVRAALRTDRVALFEYTDLVDNLSLP